jgi:hypothetical protein
MIDLQNYALLFYLHLAFSLLPTDFGLIAIYKFSKEELIIFLTLLAFTQNLVIWFNLIYGGLFLS